MVYEGKTIEQLQALRNTQKSKRNAARDEMRVIEETLIPMLNAHSAKTKLAKAGLSKAEMDALSGDE